MTAAPSFVRGPFGVKVAALLRAGQADQTFPAASALVWWDGRIVAEAAVGLDGGSVAPERRLWDLASLTKPLSVGALSMHAVSAGTLDLDAPIADDLPRHLTARALLSHRGGLSPWKPWNHALPRGFVAGAAATRFAVDALMRQDALDSAAGADAVYSDIGYMLLSRAFERRTGRPLRALVSGFQRALPPRDPARFVGCGLCPERRRQLFGEVHDPRAWVVGGAAGHAGLFATARTVGARAVGLLALAAGLAERHIPTTLRAIDGAVVRHFWSASAVRPDSGSWRLGWDSPTPGASSAGSTVAADAIGHTGFTGTSVWIEPSRRLVTVLLTNRVALGDAAQPRIRDFRPRFHDALRDTLGVA